MKQIILIIVFLGVAVFCRAEEEITITTYYPAPYGVYRELRAQRMAIGENYFDPSNYCWPPDSCDHNTSQNADLVVEGLLGVGTELPESPLHVRQSAPLGAAPFIIATFEAHSDFYNIEDGFGSGINFAISDAAMSVPNSIAIINALRDGDDNKGALAFLTADETGLNERMRITSDGNVGISTDNPSANLEVNGSVYFDGSAYISGNLGINQEDSQARLHITTTSGNRGIILDLSSSPQGSYAPFIIWDARNGGANYLFAVRQEENALVFSRYTNYNPWSNMATIMRLRASDSKVTIAGDLEVNGNLQVNGDTKSAVINTEDYGSRKLYTLESPEVWFEDFGEARLEEGKVTVKIEPIFLQTVNTEITYHVFLTPEGDCKGLYVAEKNKDSFVVKELNNGKSNISFSYRIVAKAKGKEALRLTRAE